MVFCQRQNTTKNMHDTHIQILLDCDGKSKMSSSMETTNSDAETTLAAASRALFHLGRTFSKLPLRQILTQQTARAVELSQILVVQAVEAQTAHGATATVGAVAEALAIEPSTASRLVAQTIRAGYLARTVSQTDGRAAQITLTPAGQELAEEARRYQRAVFEKITRDWPADERQEFAHLFVKFADAVGAALVDEEKL